MRRPRLVNHSLSTSRIDDFLRNIDESETCGHEMFHSKKACSACLDLEGNTG